MEVNNREQMNIVITGHVDHGKSTVIGRLLADTDALPEGKLEAVKRNCERNSKPFEYAFLLDALKDEQSQGITIDAARVFFNTKKRDYIIIDAPGHIEFLKNMITGAARAEAAFLVIDADEGVQENSRRHGFLLSMLGIRQLCVVVNKMDLVGYSKKVYKQVEKKYTKFLKNLNIEEVSFIPVSGREGDCISELSKNMPWWTGDTVLTLLDKFYKEKSKEDMPFRMPVQDVYKFTQHGDSRRIIAGTIETGKVSNGDDLVFYPSGKKTKVDKIEEFNNPNPPTTGVSGQATGFTTATQIYAKRGDIACKANEIAPQVGRVIRVSLFWLGRKPFEKGKEYTLKICGDRVKAQLFDTIRVIDASSLNSDGLKKKVERHDVADCVITTDRLVAFDIVEDIPSTSRFVIVDEFEIAGGGIIREAIEDSRSGDQHRILERNSMWESGLIQRQQRSERNGHDPALILVSGDEEKSRRELASSIEKTLFDNNLQVFYMGMKNLVAGMDSDINSSGIGGKITVHEREEHIRRMAELAHIMVQTGQILILTLPMLTEAEYDLFQMTVPPGTKASVIWIGDSGSTDVKPHFQMKSSDSKKTVNAILKDLKDREIIK